MYSMCMSRTNIDNDDKACEDVERRFRIKTKKDTVNFTLRKLASRPSTVEKARRLRGSGWEGNLEEMRSSKSL